MRSLIQKLAESAGDAPGTMLVVGAGQGADLAPMRRLAADRLILVEANPRHADMLSQRIDPGRGEEVWPLAVTPTAQAQATLQIVNQPAHSSLMSPDQLPQYFQNLHVTHQEVVPARSLVDVVEGLELDPAGRHVLVLDAPGLGAALLEALPDGQLQRFRSLIVRGGVKGLYAGEKPMDLVVAALRGRGFDLVADDSEAIFPHQAVLLARNEAACQARVARERMQLLEHALEEQTQLMAERQGQLESLASERDALGAERLELLARLTELQAQRETEAASRASLVADLRAQVQNLTQERDTQARLAAELQARLETSTAHSAAQAKRDTEREDLIHQLTQKRDLLTRHVAELKSQLEASAAQASAQTRREDTGLEKVQQLSRERDELGGQLAEQQALVQRLVQMRDTLTRQMNDYRTQAEASEAERQKQVKAGRELAEQLQVMAAESAAQKKLAEDRLVQMLAQTQEREAAVKQAAERDAAIAKLTKELEAAKASADEHQEKLERASRLSQERGTRVIELERERVELDKYQSWLNSEVIKAEAHVDLIKEILLREPGR